MAKTYGTVATFTAGSVLTAAQLNVAGGAVNNLVVPAAVSTANTGGQSITNAAWAFISFDGEGYDTDGMITPTSTTVTVNTAGIYVISASVSWPGNPTGQRICAIARNAASAGTGALVEVYQQATGALETKQSLSYIANLDVSDTIKLAVFQNSSATLNTVTGRLHMAWIGRTS